MSRAPARYEGSCHCGAVRFAVTTGFPGLTPWQRLNDLLENDT